MPKPKPMTWSVDASTTVQLKFSWFKRKVLVNGQAVARQALTSKQPLPFKFPDGREGLFTLENALGFQPDISLKVDGELVLSQVEAAQRTCLACGRQAKEGAAFCEHCGAAIPPAGVQRKMLRLKQARQAIVWVGVLFVFSGVAMAAIQQGEASKALKNLDGYADSDVFPKLIDGRTYHVGDLRSEISGEPWRILGINLLLAAVMGLLYWYSRRAPLAALVVALALILAVNVLNAIVDPANLAQGIAVKILIVAMLVNGIRSALQLRRIDA